MKAKVCAVEAKIQLAEQVIDIIYSGTTLAEPYKDKQPFICYDSV